MAYTFSPRELDRILCECPENLLYFSDAVIEREVGEENTPKVIGMLVAELAVRCFLNPMPERKKLLARFIPEEELDYLLLQGLKSHPRINVQWWMTGSAIPENDVSRRIRSQVLNRFSSLFEDTDGFIPVLDPQSKSYGALLPFRLSSARDPSAPCRVKDSRGEDIPEWCRAVSNFAPLRGVVCTLHVSQIPGQNFSGRSLMLPLMIALWRKAWSENQTEPLWFAPWRLLSTGAVSVDGKLEAVEIAGKKEAVKQIANACFLYPAVPGFKSRERNEVLIPVGSTLPEIKEKTLRIIEKNDLAFISFNYARRRIGQIQDIQRHKTHGDWKRHVEWLDGIAKKSAEEQGLRDPRFYLLYLILRSEALCHAGMSEEAVQANRKARRVAEKFHFSREELQLEIEEMVIFQDLGRLSDILALSAGLCERVEAENDEDLRMRLYGTLGQVHAEGALIGLAGASSQSSLDLFKRAVYSAYRVGKDEEIAQDLNYFHLWHALFKPGEEEERHAFDKAVNHIENNLLNNPDTQEKNRSFLQRQKSLSAYRLWRKSGLVKRARHDVLITPEKDSWIHACIAKYDGALFAAAGETDSAVECFRSGVETLANSTEPIIVYIRMTILAQGAASLAACAPEIAAEFRQKGLELFDRYDSSRNWPLAESWKSSLQDGEKDPRELPESYY